MKRFIIQPLYACFSVASVAATGLPAVANAQSYPDKPIRLVIPFATGGFADIAGRAIAQAFSETLGGTTVPDNRGGAGGLIGGEIVARAPADGYTLMLGSNGPLTVGPALYPKVPYDPLRDFAPVSMLGVTPIVLVVHPSVPARNVKELVSLLRSRPAQMTVASPGIGTSAHLAGEQFQILTSTRLVHVPYKGSGPALADLMAGHVAVSFDPLSSSLALIRSGKLRALAVTTPKRAPWLEAVPTLAEAGVSGYDASTFVALLAPAGTPRTIVDRLNGATAKALATNSVRELFNQFATVVSASTPEQLGAFLKEDLTRMQRIIKEAQLKPE
jgi:tripartite-type tricarboxylate transporter receptor subunit TctC